MGSTKAQIKGLKCERKLDRFLKDRCLVSKVMKKGADRECITPDFNLEYWEAKSGKSRLTEAQKNLKKKAPSIGASYYIFKCP